MKAPLFKALDAADMVLIDKANVEFCNEMGELVLVRVEGGAVLEFKAQEIEINPLGMGSAVDVEDVTHKILFKKMVPLSATHLIAAELVGSVMAFVASIRKKEA